MRNPPPGLLLCLLQCSCKLIKDAAPASKAAVAGQCGMACMPWKFGSITHPAARAGAGLRSNGTRQMLWCEYEMDGRCMGIRMCC
jgi:hypothetical protein